MGAPRTERGLWDYMQKEGMNPTGPRPKAPRKRSNEEHYAQAGVIKWWIGACRQFELPETLLFSIPNGGWRDPIGAKILKSEGQRNGVSDLFLAVPASAFHGLFIEMKAAKGIVSDEQHHFIAAVSTQNYACHVCNTTNQAIQIITTYLGIR